MSGHDPIADLRARMAPHGYALFLVPSRPAGWLVVLTAAGLERPLETRSGTRAEALAAAERLFVTRRLQDVDGAIRNAGLQPPAWDGTHDDHLDRLVGFAREHGVAA